MRTFVVMVLFALWPSSIWASTIHVPADYPNLWQAVSASSEGDTIEIASGTYVIPGYVSIPHSITIQGAADADVTIQKSSGTLFVTAYLNVDFDLTFRNIDIEFTGTNPGGPGPFATAFSLGTPTIANVVTLNVEDCSIANATRGFNLGRYVKDFRVVDSQFTNIRASENVPWGFFQGEVIVRNGLPVGETLERTTVVENCRFEDCDTGIYGGVRNMDVTGNDFIDCEFAIDCGVSEDATIDCNNFENNDVAIRISLSSGSVSAVDNNFIQNTVAVDNQTSVEFSMENNYWGDASGPNHTGNPNGTGDQIIGNVDYDPWLTSEHDCDAIISEISTATIFGTRRNPIGKVSVTLEQGQSAIGFTFILEKLVNGQWIFVTQEVGIAVETPQLFDTLVDPYVNGSSTSYRVYVVDSNQNQGPYSPSETAVVAADINGDGKVYKRDYELYRLNPFDMDCDGDVDSADKKTFDTWLGFNVP